MGGSRYELFDHGVLDQDFLEQGPDFVDGAGVLTNHH